MYRMTTVSEISPTQLNILPSTHTGQRSRQVVISTTRRNHTSSRVNCPTLKRGDHTHLHMYKPIYCHSTHIVQHSYGYLAAIIFRCSLSLPISFLTCAKADTLSAEVYLILGDVHLSHGILGRVRLPCSSLVFTSNIRLIWLNLDRFMGIQWRSVSERAMT